MNKQLLNATMISSGTRVMLEANGQDDRKRGNTTWHEGWKEIAEACDYPVNESNTCARSVS